VTCHVCQQPLAAHISLPSPCPCGPGSTVGGLRDCHPSGGCTGWGHGGLLCRDCAAKATAVLDQPVTVLGLDFGGKRVRSVRRQAEVDMSPEAVKARAEAKRRESEALAYVAAYTGTWGLPLDIRADRRWGTKYMHLSDRQVEVLLDAKARDAQREEERKARTATVEKLTDGMYKDPDGVIYKVQRALNGSGHLYAKRLVIGEGSGTFEYERGAISRLRLEWRMTVEEAAAFGRLYGWCCVCGRPLTDEQSIERGIGPVCAGRLA
jgi:hypothetical protein